MTLTMRYKELFKDKKLYRKHVNYKDVEYLTNF